MTSRRCAASRQAQADLDNLLNATLPFAQQQQLDAHGEFYPFGACVGADGTTGLTAADAGEGQRPDSRTVLDVLYAGARADRAANRAAAFVADVATPDGDAIRVELEHADGAALVLLLPYRRGRLTRRVSYGELTAGPGDRRIWADG
jgi:hypothetical protein